MRSKDPNQVPAPYVTIWNEAAPERRREDHTTPPPVGNDYHSFLR